MKYEFVFQLFYDTLMIDILLLYPICQFIMYMIMVSVEKYRYPQKKSRYRYQSPISKFK